VKTAEENDIPSLTVCALVVKKKRENRYFDHFIHFMRRNVF